MRKIAGFIVNNNKFVIFVFILLVVYGVWGTTKTKVEYDIATYLPQDTDTRQAISIMEDEFVTYGSTELVVRNVTFDEADALAEAIRDIPGVRELNFENTPDYYNNSEALFNISFEGDEDDELSVSAHNKAMELLEGYDVLVYSALVDDFAATLSQEISRVLVLVIIIIIGVLLLTSSSVAVVPVFLLTFGVAAILNMGTNYWFGTISFISNSVCVILQLALAIDYAIILYNRFEEEKKIYIGDAYEAMTEALSKAIIEISSSSLTTISGLLALTTMSLRLGADLGLVLAKSIIWSMLTVFLLMPAVLVNFASPIKTKKKIINLIDDTHHRNLVPKISFVGKFTTKFRVPLLIAFAVIVGVCTVLSFRTDYVYSTNSIDTDRPSDSQIAESEIEKTFGYSSQFVILMPGRDYDRQKEVLDLVESYSMIKEATGLPNTEIKMNGVSVYLTQQLTYKEFSTLLATDTSIGDSIYTAYAYFTKDTMEDKTREVALYETNKDIYTASLLDLCDCAFANDDFISAYLYNDADSLESYEDLRDQVQDAEKQLIGENYCRLVFAIDGPVESDETFALIDELLDVVKTSYPETIFAGESMSAYDLNESFSADNIKVSLFTIVFVFIILMFTFKSWGLPIPLTVAIQGAIFVNFSYYSLTNTNCYFFVYLIVSAIQMGATIDYAIVITNRFEALKTTMNRRDAIITAINDAFPTILTSGLIMAASGILIGKFVSNPLIATLGDCLGRGIIISIISVMFALPAMLYIFNKAILKTHFRERRKTDVDKRFERMRKFQADRKAFTDGIVAMAKEHAPKQENGNSAGGSIDDGNPDDGRPADGNPENDNSENGNPENGKDDTEDENNEKN